MDLSNFIKLAAKLDHLDYYQVLGLKRNADASEIRRAYHKRARTIHPDNFYNHPDKHFCYAIDKIFKRVNEAYLVLRDEEKRSHYNQGLIGEVKRLRYTEEDDQAIREEKKAVDGRTPQGRKYLSEAKRQHRLGNLDKARKTLQMAIAFEPDNKHFQELLASWK